MKKVEIRKHAIDTISNGRGHLHLSSPDLGRRDLIRQPQPLRIIIATLVRMVLNNANAQTSCSRNGRFFFFRFLQRGI